MRGLLEIIARRSGRLGRKKIAEIAQGAAERGEYGPLAGFTVNQLIDLIDALEGADLVATGSGHYPTLGITEPGKEALREGLPTIQILGGGRAPGRSAAARAAVPDEVLDSPEGTRLRDLRTRLSQEKAVPPYVILTNRTIAAIVAAAPRSLEELGRVPGIGPAKLTSYGEAILEALG
jgi:ATP-dependent DNA helicase RecQ